MALSKAIEMAVKMEKDAIDFYKEALEKTDHPSGVKMFEHFIQVEIQHIRLLKKLVKEVAPDAKLIYPDEHIKTLFSEQKSQMMERIKPTTDDLEAIKIALDFELKGYNFYKKYTEEAETESEKKLFKILTSQEKEHSIILKNAHEHMKKTGSWFNWEDLPKSQT